MSRSPLEAIVVRGLIPPVAPQSCKRVYVNRKTAPAAAAQPYAS